VQGIEKLETAIRGCAETRSLLSLRRRTARLASESNPDVTGAAGWHSETIFRIRKKGPAGRKSTQALDFLVGNRRRIMPYKWLCIAILANSIFQVTPKVTPR
jgi:hypothetical protein